MPEEQKQNGINGSKQLNWPTVILIIVTGGGNFLAGQQGKSQLSYEQQEAMAKIRQIHESLDNFESGMKASLNNQAKILNNQSLMIEDQGEILKQLKA